MLSSRSKGNATKPLSLQATLTVHSDCVSRRWFSLMMSLVFRQHWTLVNHNAFWYFLGINCDTVTDHERGVSCLECQSVVCLSVFVFWWRGHFILRDAWQRQEAVDRERTMQRTTHWRGSLHQDQRSACLTLINELYYLCSRIHWNSLLIDMKQPLLHSILVSFRIGRCYSCDLQRCWGLLIKHTNHDWS